MRPDRLRAISLSIAEVTPKTRWIFLEVETEAGLRGSGEATLPGRETAVADAAAKLAPIALALPDTDPIGLPPCPPDDLPAAAAYCALDQALWDVEAQRLGLPISNALGTVRRERIPVYANINRGVADRSPANFAASARAAIAAGHNAIKLAPFDEATVRTCREGDFRALLLPGIARIAAVHDMLEPGQGLLVDCHWRLTAPAADYVIAAAAEFGVRWIECPLPETAESIDAITRLRAGANQRGMLLAGLETAIGVRGFRPFVKAGAYDVMMPDIKYVGGLKEMLAVAELLRGADIAFSPHNPSGPVCHAMSLHVCAVAAELHSLEIQFGETPHFTEFAGADLQKTRDGDIGIPLTPGSGVRLHIASSTCQSSTRWTAA